MSKLSKRRLEKFLCTTAGESALQVAALVVSKEIISAAKYYMGVPDGQYFKITDFDENVVKARKAYVTFNTLMGGETAEKDRFDEGKKQIPELITSLGIKKMINLFTHLYCFGERSKPPSFETVRACRQTEISVGTSTVGPLTSTTKLSIEEIMALGYGDKNCLAICCYHFHNGSVIFDMEELGEDYLKPEEREVLILMGNRLVTHCSGYSKQYIGKDGAPALMYDIDVYSPDFGNIEQRQQELERIVYNEDTITEIKLFLKALNEETVFPNIPASYKEWKSAFKNLVFCELKKF